MQKRSLIVGLILIFICYLTLDNQAQSLSTGTTWLEDYYRRAQLIGIIDLNHSFVSYPLFPSEAFGKQNPFDPENLLAKSHFIKFNGNIPIINDNYTLKLLPISWKSQYNSHHPEGFNDGPMIPSKGYQNILSAGFYFKSDHFSIRIQPEFVHAANIDYEGFPLERKDPNMESWRWYEYYDSFLNYIDKPKLFGDGVYNKAFWGQSSIRLTINSVSIGFSTENIWWGPGIRNSLLMTNTAPGFAHFTLNSVKPIKTIIGSFEGQIIAGWLKNSGYLPPESERTNRDGWPLYRAKRTDGRYINGVIISYQPKWVPGLFIGLIRSFQIYHNDMGEGIIDYLPIFSAFGRKSAEAEDGSLKKYDFYNSLFFRFVWPESHVEIYGEYGRSDYYWDKQDLILQPEHSAAYIIGFRKLIPIKSRPNEHIQVHVEMTQLAKNSNTQLRLGDVWIANSWYTSSTVNHGYTNNGQYLGAGIGSGSNLQTLNISWVKSLKKIGIQLERYAHNEDFLQDRVKDIRAHWVDISTSLVGTWDYKNLLFTLNLKAVVSKNYQWLFDYNPNDFWGDPSPDTFNFHGQLGITYRF